MIEMEDVHNKLAHCLVANIQLEQVSTAYSAVMEITCACSLWGPKHDIASGPAGPAVARPIISAEKGTQFYYVMATLLCMGVVMRTHYPLLPHVHVQLLICSWTMRSLCELCLIYW